MELDKMYTIKIIKSTKGLSDPVFKEEVVQECANSEDVLKSLKLLQQAYEDDTSYELLHGVRDHLSVSFKHKTTQQEVFFYAASSRD